jgi:GNAT superfamily N-acetyltransferase
MTDILVREMRKKDLDRVSDLSGQLGYPVPVDILEGRFSRIHDDPGQALFVAESETKIIGWIHVHPQWVLESEPHAEIAALVVDQAARRTGAGRALVLEVQRWARRQGFSRVRVRSNIKRQEAHKFYPALGFIWLKTQHNYDLSLDE